jgi:hypothetical protein
MRPEVKEVNCTTGEIIVREMNDEEFANYQSDVANYEAKIKAQAQADADKAQANADKAALLAKLGITADEAKLLLS